ncbi:MAG: redoxin domain-containing protein [Chloroflexi bacterium]|nr:redoxin domain-containing protein [Chloroflexota bacterium]
MAAFQEKNGQLESLGATVYVASADPLERAQEVASRSLTYSVAYGVTRADCDLFGGWWDEDRGFAEPSEFIIERGGAVLASIYASGPLGRMEASEVVTFLTNREKRLSEGKGGTSQ